MERKQAAARIVGPTGDAAIEEKVEFRLSERAKTWAAVAGAVIAIGTGIGGYFANQARDEERIAYQRERQAQTEQTVQQIQKDVVETRNDVKWIMRRLGK